MSKMKLRAAFIEANKKRSTGVDRPIRVQFDDEKFVFEAGKLVEYELDVPVVEDSYEWGNSSRKESK